MWDQRELFVFLVGEIASCLYMDSVEKKNWYKSNVIDQA